MKPSKSFIGEADPISALKAEIRANQLTVLNLSDPVFFNLVSLPLIGNLLYQNTSVVEVKWPDGVEIPVALK